MNRLRLEATVPPEEEADVACTGPTEHLVLGGTGQAANQGAEDAVEEGGITSGSASSSTAAAIADLEQELLFWLDAPLTFIDFLWGLVECAKLLPAEGWMPSSPDGRGSYGEEGVVAGSRGDETGEEQQQLQEQQQEDQQQQAPALAAADAAGGAIVLATTLEKLQMLLAGQGGLYVQLLGIPVASPSERQEGALACEAEEAVEIGDGVEANKEAALGVLDAERDLEE